MQACFPTILFGTKTHSNHNSFNKNKGSIAYPCTFQKIPYALQSTAMHRLFVEKKEAFQGAATSLLNELKESLGLDKLEGIRLLQRYDVEGISDDLFSKASQLIFSEPQVDTVASKLDLSNNETAFAVEYLPGQYDQRADSASQCIQILSQGKRPEVQNAQIYILKGQLTASELSDIKDYLINQVDSREASLAAKDSLTQAASEPANVEFIEKFIHWDETQIREYKSQLGLAMTAEDLLFTQDHFKKEGRNPSITEIKMLDTYWSDHCRHTTFFTKIDDVKIDNSLGYVQQAYADYQKSRDIVYGADTERPETMMDIAVIAMKELRKTGELNNLEVSEEINAASIIVPVDVNGTEEEWLIQFKNETHNHPTEIEPFGGAATCLGGAIRDPLSGRAYVYQAMRVTGAANPLTPFNETMENKLPQRKICQGAADGYSSYGNQIGIATGKVSEIYHPRFIAKRMEIGAVVSAVPRENVFRGEPADGDAILLIGGRTGRDGVGGATGSSKEHTDTALENSAEVQKGNAPTERALQRLFRIPEFAKKIKRCNDFGAGGVSVAIGELADSLEINLDKVLKKYDGLDGTELAISESQERMAVVIEQADVARFFELAEAENLECSHVANVTNTGRLKMTWRGDTIVDLCRDFLDSNGVQLSANIKVEAPTEDSPLGKKMIPSKGSLEQRLTTILSDLNECSQKGLAEQFDSSIGANTVLSPFGGKTQLTPTDAMVAKVPMLKGETETATFMSWGYNPLVACWSPYHGALYAVTESVARLVSSGAQLSEIRLTLQEYFEKLGQDSTRWGKPFSALLGAFTAQNALRLAAIGGKDSMSGSFKDIDVPPTLVSFAVAPGKAKEAISQELKTAGNKLYWVNVSRDEEQIPDFEQMLEKADAIFRLAQSGDIASMHTLGQAGIAAGISRMAFGNGLGVTLQTDLDLYQERLLSWVIEAPASLELPATLEAIELGSVTGSGSLKFNDETVSLKTLQNAWASTLEPVYPTQARTSTTETEIQTITNKEKAIAPRINLGAKPKVVIPVFPGTNCEFDTARQFEMAGANAEIFVFKNKTQSQIEESLASFAKQIESSQIFMAPGGFSAGDEPDGSGKFIATILRNSQISDSLMSLLNDRDGLALGICNGFQALVKVGLLPYGEIRTATKDSPTLTLNNIGRHVSCYVNTRISSTKSPWLANTEVGDLHSIPVSHGEGKFYANSAELQKLIDCGQIATQYVDGSENASMDITHNPNGSLLAIEGITSHDGRILGKMGHSERLGNHVAKNIPGNKDQGLFSAGVNYFS